MYSVAFHQVSKSYPVYRQPADRLKELLWFGRRKFHDDFWALREVSFEVRKGETFCLIGENGSGKSTTLQLVAGILRATAGQVEVSGRVSALLELGAGFNPEFTGRDNVYLNAAILGFSTRQTDRIFPAIEEFAEIGDFINQPVKTYSSGMLVRLAFSVAIHVDPEILLVDEALAVGDIYFRQRCLRKVHDLRRRGITILFVSHAVSDVKALGDRTVWLDNGAIREIGATDAVVSRYLAAMTEKDGEYRAQHIPGVGAGPAVEPPEVESRIPNIDHRYGDKRAEIVGIGIYDAQGAPLSLLEPGSAIVLRISVRANDPIADPNVGFLMRNHLGIDFAATNTKREGFDLPPMRPGDVYTIDFYLELPVLYPGTFSFSPAIADGGLSQYRMCDWIENALALPMGPADGEVYGYVHLPCRVELNARMPEARQTETALG